MRNKSMSKRTVGSLAATPPGSKSMCQRLSGGIAALGPRLMAVTPAGVERTANSHLLVRQFAIAFSLNNYRAMNHDSIDSSRIFGGESLHPGGVRAISRGLSEAIPPDRRRTGIAPRQGCQRLAILRFAQSGHRQ